MKQKLYAIFFFQAEDGIRPLTVTGVQTCALPISGGRGSGSSSCRPCTSFFKMRIDWPSERAADGSFFDPNSTRITRAMIKIFHGLSNRSPSMDVLLSG